ncbi:MAG: hypothetical protein HYZ26_05095 [Chloroflexi bacterium]|nr:hypothetical protein [Chloroflexota bacterium]
MSALQDRRNPVLPDAIALARQAHANAMKAARAEFAAVMRQLNQAAGDPADSQAPADEFETPELQDH